MKYFAYIAMTFATLLFLSCTLEPSGKPDQNPSEVIPDEELTLVEFTESNKIFANPERGFYKHYDFLNSSASPLSVSALQAARVESNITLFYTGHYLTEFVKSDISDKFLNLVRTNMQALRDAGAKCVLRFAYTNSQSKKPWDAEPKWVARHIEQLKPILQEYSDVILCFQSGFIGVWGEGYYTDNFFFDPQTPEEHKLRKEVIDAMLDAIPADRQVALRTPMFKRNMYATSYTDTLTLATAYDGSAKARICAFNDCFGASADDYGTFIGKDTREYWRKETRYTLMGGETCGLSDYCKCKQSIKDCEDFHWTYMNSGYNADVLNRWESDGCMDEVKRRLGYRLSLKDVATSKAAAGKALRVKLNIRNTGFAAPGNPRHVELVLVDGNGKKTVYEFKDVDVRYWFANETVIVDKLIDLPKDASGNCTLYLNMPDPKATLHDNPLFSIRLANDGVWNEKTGYNKIAEFKL
ncbi:MAG: DUF4832 domain-containing protein [Bacteroidales bacterium]|nr:DUF4832 domain-containing protein [Bacteroidales bacterium]